MRPVNWRRRSASSTDRSSWRESRSALPRITVSGVFSSCEATVRNSSRGLHRRLGLLPRLLLALQGRVALLLGQLALGDVARVDDDAANARLVQQIRGRPLQVAPTAVAVPDAVFESARGRPAQPGSWRHWRRSPGSRRGGPARRGCGRSVPPVCIRRHAPPPG